MASIVSYNTELVATLESLRDQREDLHRSILRDEEEKGRIQKELTVLTERLGTLNSDLAKKIHTRNEFDAAISETEGAYMKVSNRCARGRARGRALATPQLKTRLITCLCLLASSLHVLPSLQIMESSQTLLSVLKREQASLTKRRGI